MNTKIRYQGPSVFTPFLRRFTDERARDLSETIELYQEVRGAYLASPWANENAVERASKFIADCVGDIVTLPPSRALLKALDRCQTDVLALETTIFSSPKIDWDIARLSLKEQVDLRRFLRAQQHFLANQDRISDQLVTALGNVFGGIISELPTLPDKADDSLFTVPLVALLHDPGSIVDRIIGTVYTEALADAGLFTTLQEHIYENVCFASGISPGQEARSKQIITADESELAPVELVETYLKGTPFCDLLLTPMPFTIPQPVRFEHTHVIGGSGWGKSTLLLDQIVSDLSQPDPPALVVIDPKGTMAEKLQHLELFNPDTGRLKDRLLIVNPHDVNFPPALNMFEAGSRRFRTYSDEIRRQIENNTVSLYHYIFGSMATALTAKQAVAFSFVVRLLFAIPGATIHTLLQLMEEDTGKDGITTSHFKTFIDRLPRTARSFFENHFFHPTEFRETRQQITHRLYAILQYPEFDAMFSSKLRKLDLFDCLQNRKVVIANTAKGLLGKEGSQLFGRYLIALTLGAAFERLSVSKSQWNPAFLIIDEAQEFVDEEKTQELLQQAREFNLGVTISHQQIEGQMSEALRSTLAANTSIKYAGGVSARDASFMAKDMRCEPDFVLQQRKRAGTTQFACYVRGFTESPVSVTLPLWPHSAIDKEPVMSETAYQKLLEHNRRQIAVLPDEHLPFRDSQSANTPAPNVPAETAISLDPNADKHTDPASRW